MEFNEFLKLIARKKQTIFAMIFATLVITIGLSLISPLKYGAKSRLLVLQDAASSDAYSLSKSNEYLGNLFSQVVSSSSFYDQVRSSQYNIDKNYFSGNYSQQLKKWNQTVKTSTQGDTGIIEVNVYHPNVQEAKQIALAVNDILINKNQDYHGGQNVKVNIIDQPLISNYPVKPNLPYNAVIAIVASLVFALFYIYIFPERKNDLNILGGKSHKNIKINNNIIREDSIQAAQSVQAEREYLSQNIRHDDNHNNHNDHIIHGNMGNVLRK